MSRSIEYFQVIFDEARRYLDQLESCCPSSTVIVDSHHDADDVLTVGTVPTCIDSSALSIKTPTPSKSCFLLLCTYYINHAHYRPYCRRSGYLCDCTW